MSAVLLVGLLADARMLDAFGLTGTPQAVGGRLEGGGRAGIDRDGWPRLLAGQGTLAAMRVFRNAALDRYAEVMGLAPQDHPDGPVLGLGAGGPDGEPQVDLAVSIARHVLAVPADRTADGIARRLSAIGVRAASELRGAESPASGGDLVERRGPGDVQVLGQDEPFESFFSVQVSHLRHRTHAGGMTPSVRREAVVLGDAVVVLPWDPVRDRVLLVEQFRMAPLLRRDPQPWLLETIAGRVDAGETVEDAARREAREEANLTITRLFPAVHHYPSPGVLGEYLYLYVGIADLPDGVEGLHGLESEDEDIRSLVIDRARLTEMAMSGQLSNGPLVMIALWLELRHHAIRAELGAA
ncbi:NUDIX domain-containing protein [Paracoccus benzoatiresistens]|uniref:ADP-ribose pyrophosphatase n=1 Tax=Paracoccus benzoatiresistens TaxID=2997341 RepID=A0ABT4J2N0_9RHOB|nr:NUDIX domain-containing protein [Paracoccus sp. EF6]MCZ0961149.1 NUDIX domain-containing protein [Paracoccus sp. EF6]